MNLTRAFEWNGATITVRRSTIGDRLAIHVISRHLMVDAESEVERYQVAVFAEYVQRSTVAGDLGFAFPSSTATAKELHAAMAAFLQMDEALYYQWENALTEVNAAPNAPALTPDAADPNV